MNEGNSPFFGEIEIDETYVGGKHSGKRGRGAEGKTVVMGMVERKGNARVFVTPDVKTKTLLPNNPRAHPHKAGDSHFH